MIDKWDEKRQRLSEALAEDDELLETVREIDEDFNKPNEYKAKFEEMKKKYAARFMSSGEAAKEDQKEDIEKDDDSTEMSYDNLFTKREGDYK